MPEPVWFFNAKFKVDIVYALMELRRAGGESVQHLTRLEGFYAFK